MRYNKALAQLREQERTCRESTGGQAARYRIAIANHAAVRIGIRALELLAEVAACEPDIVVDSDASYIAPNLPPELWERIKDTTT